MAANGPASTGTALCMLSPCPAPMPSTSSSVGRGPAAAPSPLQALGFPATAAREAGTQQRGNTTRHAVPLLALETVAAAAISIFTLRPSKRGRRAKALKKLRRTRPVPWNIYSPKTPLKGTLTKNYDVPRDLTAGSADEEICHLTFDHGGAYFFVEGQVVGLMSTTGDPEKEAPANMQFFSVASSPRGDDQTSTTMSICVRRAEKEPPPAEEAAEPGLSSGLSAPEAEAAAAAPKEGAEEEAENAAREPAASKEEGPDKDSSPGLRELHEMYAKAKGSIPEVEKLEEILAKARRSIPEVEKLDELLAKAKGSPQAEKLDELLTKAKGSIPDVENLDAMIVKARSRIPELTGQLELDEIFRRFLRRVGYVLQERAEQEKAQKVADEEEEVASEPAAREVKTVADLCDLESGDEVIMTGPTGAQEALLPEDPQANLIMIATGTGIAPMRSYCRTLFHDMAGMDGTSGQRKFKGLAWLIHGASSESSLLYHDEHQHYAAAFRDNFRYDPCTPTDRAGTLSALREKVYLYHEVLWTLLQDERTHLVVSALSGVEELLREALNHIAIENGSDWYTLRDMLIEEGRYHVEEH